MAKFSYRVDDEHYTVELIRTSEGYRATLDGQEFAIRLVKALDGEFVYVIGDRTERAYCASDGQRRWVFMRGKTFVLTSAMPGARPARGAARAQATDQTIRAPMPGNVRAVQVAEGDSVAKGQTLVVLEAMKMEIRIQAPSSGKLARLAIKVGQQVERDQVLAEMAP